MEILHDQLPFKPWMAAHTKRLPGIQPLDVSDWLIRDERFAAQMAYRDQLIASKPKTVMVSAPTAKPAIAELFDVTLNALDTGYHIASDGIERPDGVRIAREPNLINLGRLVQEDMIILQPIDGSYILTAGVLCFPASWTLTEKFGKTLDAIHIPVAQYTESIANSVNRMFAAIRVEQPLWRANFLIYDDADLHQPRTEGEERTEVVPRFLRVERQALRRLPQTGAVVFGIHTFVTRISSLTDDERESLLSIGHETL